MGVCCELKRSGDVVVGKKSAVRGIFRRGGRWGGRHVRWIPSPSRAGDELSIYYSG